MSVGISIGVSIGVSLTPTFSVESRTSSPLVLGAAMLGCLIRSTERECGINRERERGEGRRGKREGETKSGGVEAERRRHTTI